MLLGIVLHAAIAYSTMPTESYSWHLHERERSQLFDVLIIFIHSFRIPLFFLLSGYFMHLVLQRRGSLHFVRSRFRRIVVPFAIALLVLTPLVDASFAFAVGLPIAGTEGAFAHARSYLFSVDGYGGFRLLHLWFLYYLLLIYGLVLIGLRLFPRWFTTVGDSRFASGLVIPVLVLSPVFFHFMDSGSIDTPTHFLPLHPAVLLFYLMWFLAGWKLRGNPGHLEEMKRHSGVLLATGAAGLAAHLIVLEAFYSAPGFVPGTVRAVNAALASVVTTCLSFGILGAFARAFPSPNQTITFLGESSYWAYLVHLPVVVVVVGILQLSDMSAFLKYPVVVLVSSALVLGSYLPAVALYRYAGRTRSPLPIIRRWRPAAVDQ